MSTETRSGFLTKPFRSRSRRGCLICRQHRLKCDEKSPRCGNCSRLEKHCKWGLKASFHSSRIYHLSTSDSIILSKIDSERQPSNDLTFVNETKNIEREYDEIVFQHESNRYHENEPLLQEDGSHSSEVGSDRYMKSSRTQNHQPVTFVDNGVSQAVTETTVSDPGSFRNPEQFQDLITLPSTVSDRPIYSASNHTSLVNLVSQTEEQRYISHTSSQQVLVWPISDHIKAGLLSSYFQDSSRWCEVTSSSRPFSTLSGHLVIESQVFAAAAVLIASIKSLRRDYATSLLAKELYAFAWEALQLLVNEHSKSRLLATILLCMSCSALDRTDKLQSALHDCAYLLQATAFTGISYSLSSACFWAFARQDIWAAYLSGRPTLIATKDWRTAQDQTHDIPIQDSYSNQAIYITARIVNELSQKLVDINEATLRSLWLELQTWIVERPQSVKCIMEVDASGDSVFPTILFSNPSAVCGNIYYHVASVLLLATGKIPDDSSAMTSLVCHANRAASISITNNEQANLVNNIPLVYVAARHIHTAVGKIAILKHLKEIENQTGWITSRYVLDLENIWGL